MMLNSFLSDNEYVSRHFELLHVFVPLTISKWYVKVIFSDTLQKCKNWQLFAWHFFYMHFNVHIYSTSYDYFYNGFTDVSFIIF